MITHTDINSKNFEPEADLYLVKPRALPTGEVQQNGIVLEMDQNTSIVDRPTLGKVINVGNDLNTDYIDETIIWVEQDGIDIELEDGLFILLQHKSILGKIKNIKEL